jgi:hypothetical protein
MTLITDGAGTGYKAKVNGNQRLYVNAVTITEDEQANKIGNAYNINTGEITLTSAAQTPVLYLKNNEDQSIHITAVAIGLANSDGTATDMTKIVFVRNPTAGTIVSSPVNVDINGNRNYGSNNTLTADAYKGATGKTMTDGDDHILVYGTARSRVFVTIDEIIPKGSSFGLKITPPSSNTSMTVYAAVICHLEDVNE